METQKKKTVILPVLHMTCASCAVSVESMLKAQPGISSAAVNYANATAVIEYNPDKISLEEFRKTVQQIGYDLLISTENSKEQLEHIQQDQTRLLKHRTIWSIVLSIPVTIIGMFYMNMPYANYMMWALSTPVILWFGKQFFVNAYKQALHGKANMDTLVALSTAVAYLFSIFNTLNPGYWHSKGIHAHVYFEAASVVIAFILLGKLLEEKARGNASSAIKKLMGLQPGTVTLIHEGGHTMSVPIEQVNKGDLLLVKPGEKIAVDGVVVSGTSYVDESMLSGEPVAILKKAQDNVFAGTINQKGSFQFKAMKVGSETMLSQIIRTVQEAQGSKAPVQKLVDRIAGIFVPAVITIALLSFLLWYWLGGENGLTHGLLAMVTVLVIACPCALGLATPTAIMVGVGKGAEQGILIKDAESLELAEKINAVVLDKTGTITEGKPVVTDLQWRSQKDTLPDVLVSIESRSEHPLANAVVNYFTNNSAKNTTEFHSITGRGASAIVDGKKYYVGNRHLLEDQQISSDELLSLNAEQWASQSKTVIWFADESNALAVLAVADQVKPSSRVAVQQLQEEGIEVYMLTGDNENTARAIAAETGILHYKADVLPHEKANFIKALQEEGKIVAMAGDGINDSTALAQANVSIAMGKGSDIAMDVAKMTILSSDLTKIPLAIKLSRKTVRTIRQNLFWAFIYNIIGIPLAAGILYPVNGFLLNPMIAGAAMALSSISVVSNSLRLKWISSK